MNLKPTEKITQAIEAVRVWMPQVPQLTRNLVEEVREDPKVLVQSTAVRLTALVSGGLLLVLIVYGLGEWLAPSSNMGKPTDTVLTRVRCLNPRCTWSKQGATIHVDRDFNAWPMECPQCKQKTLYPLVHCHNAKCRQWVVPKILKDGSRWCPRCGAPL